MKWYDTVSFQMILAPVPVALIPTGRVQVGYLLITGMKSDVLGIFSAMMSKLTLKARRTVIPSDSFSPASGGR